MIQIDFRDYINESRKSPMRFQSHMNISNTSIASFMKGDKDLKNKLAKAAKPNNHQRNVHRDRFGASQLSNPMSQIYLSR